MTPTSPRRRRASAEFPNELEVRVTRDFDAPIELVFDVFTKPEHVVHHFAPFDEEVRVSEIDLRVGGDYHYVMVTSDGTECSFRGTFLEIDPPHRTVQTWTFGGWPDAEAVETMELAEVDGLTRLTNHLVFGDAAGRAHMTRYDGLEASFDHVEDYLESLSRPPGPAGA